MKIAKQQLKQIIKEELSSMVNEAEYGHKISSDLRRRSAIGPEETGKALSQTIKDVSPEQTVDIRRAVSDDLKGDVRGERTIDITKKDGGKKSLASRFVGGEEGVESVATSVPREKTNQPIQLPGQKKSLKITSGGQKLKPGDEGYFAAQEELGYPGLPEAGETGEERHFVKSADVSEFETAKAMKETLKRWKELIND